MRTISKLTGMTGAAALAAALVLANVTTAADAAPARSPLAGTIPSWATAKALRGSAPADEVVHARVYLPWRNQASLDAFSAAVATPGTASYGHYLSAQQFRASYAPTQQDVTKVRQWLQGAGLSIAEVPDNGHYVSVEGTVAQAQEAFGTTLGNYEAFGRTLRAPEKAATVPADLAGVVSAVVGLDDSSELITIDNTTGTSSTNGKGQSHGAPGLGFRAGQPCATYYGSSTVTTPFSIYGSTTTPLAPCGYTPAQVRGLYGLDQTDTGANQTVAFVGANASPTLQQDLNTYSDRHGLPRTLVQQRVAPGVYRHPDTPQQVPGDYYGEQTLDVEAIHTTAPGAKLLYVGSSNAYQDFDASINQIVDKSLASIISISYGFGGEAVPQGYINSLDKTFQEAVATGIGVFVSSGDSGDEISNTGVAQPDFYANDPYVTAVGGTSAAIIPAPSTITGTTVTPPAGGTPSLGDSTTSALVAAAGWKRGFEVGWQTSADTITGGTITPTTSGSPTYVVGGSLATSLPGTYTSGAGGGQSRVFSRPAYQQALAVPGSGRVVPDISLLADPNTGFLVGQTQQFSKGTYYDEYRIGGTSLAAPLMAGLAAVANQKAGRQLGFLNPLIYAVYGSSARSSLYDVDQNDLFCGGDGCTTADPLPALVRVNYVDSESPAGGLALSVRTQETPLTTLHTVRGYDTGSGVGSPASGFAAALGAPIPKP